MSEIRRAVWIFCLGAAIAMVVSSRAHAVPLTFTVDPVASGAPPTFSGTLSGDFDPFDRTFTIAAGNLASSAYAGPVTIAPTTVFDGDTILGNVEAIASGSGTFSVPALTIDNISGVVTDGGPTSGLTGVYGGGTSLASGTATFEVDSFIFDDTSTVTFSAELAALPALGSPVELTDFGAGARLDLPVGLSASITTLDMDASGALGPFTSLLGDLPEFAIEIALNDLISTSLPSTIVATSPTPLPALPLDVSYAVDATQSFLASGGTSTALGGTIVGRWYDGTLDLSGGNVIEASFSGAPLTGITGSDSGISWDFDLSSASLDVSLDLLEGRIGNAPRPLDGLGVQGSFAASGLGTFMLDILGTSLTFEDIAFSVQSDFDLDTDIETGITTLIRTLDLETVTIPFSVDLAGIGVANVDADIQNGGALGSFAELFLDQFSSVFVTQFQQLALLTLPPLTFDGQIVATRTVAAAPPDEATQVPEPPTWLLAALGLALLARKRLRNRHSLASRLRSRR